MLYAAKSYWPNVTSGDLACLAGRMETVREARFTGSLLIADDDLVLLVFEAASPGDVQRASHRAGIPCERVMRLEWLAASDNEGRTRCGHS